MAGLSQPTDLVLRYARIQRNYLWDVLLPDIGFNLSGLVGLTIGQFVQKVSFGDYTIASPSTRQMGPYRESFAGMLEVPKINMTFLKPMPDLVSMYINSWKKLIIDDSGLYQPKSKYQKNIYIRFLDSTSIAIGRYKLIGCFPVTFPSYNLDYNNNNVTTVEVSFTCDKIEYEIFG